MRKKEVERENACSLLNVPVIEPGKTIKKVGEMEYANSKED
jgi:hypothetical protein